MSVKKVVAFDPSLLDDHDFSNVFLPSDFIVECPHPVEAGAMFEIPCRHLDPGESSVFTISAMEKYPERVEKDFSDMTQSERKEHVEYVKVLNATDVEMFIEVSLVSIVESGWTRDRISKLPIPILRKIYEGAIGAVSAENVAVETFSETDSGEVSPDKESVS